MKLETRTAIFLVLALGTAACGTSPASSDAGPTTDGGGDTGSSAVPTCAGFNGVCVARTSSNPCPVDTVPVRDGSAVLCSGANQYCCVPSAVSQPGAAVPLVGNWGLACSRNGSFKDTPKGSCAGSMSCDAACSCGAPASAAPTCDCSRGLPPSSPGADACALSTCGTISCGPGCHCANAAQNACACP